MAKILFFKLETILNFVAISLSFGLTLFYSNPLAYLEVKAAPATTEVTVSGNTPVFTAGPAENPASDGTTPTNVGANVTFEATASDADFDNYFLAICKTDSVTPGGPGAPTCGGGNWCISTSTADDAQASCTYAAQSGDAESQAWFAFVCDAVSGQQCSASSQGTGASGSPFKVNHAPSFTAMTDGSDNPGGSITFTSTASDSDTDTAADTVKLFVCGDSGATSSGCTGTTLCSATLTASNPSCNYTLPSVIEDGNYTYYPYVFDSHNFGATTNPLSSVDYTVNQVAPTTSNVVVNSSSAISLTENTTTAVSVTGTVTDNNSCQDVSAAVTSLYRSAVTYATCDTTGENNNNSCYADVSCSVSGGSCTSNTDGSADYTCTVNVQYHADPTDTSTQYDAQNWLATIEATDAGSNVHAAESAVGVEMNSLVALNITSTINYGTILAGQNSASPVQTTVTATGNVGLDTEVSSTSSSTAMCTDYPTCAGSTIAIAQQEYSASTFSYGAGTDLTITATNLELNVLKTTITGSPETKILYWAIGIPVAQTPGSYTGSNTVTAVKGEVGEW